MEKNNYPNGIMHQCKDYQAILELMGDIDKNSKIVDLGCGKGDLKKLLNNQGWGNVRCYDMNKLNKNIEFIDLNKPFPFKDETIDIVIMNGVIEHLENKWHIFRECYRILKKEGIFCFTTPNINSIFNKIYFMFTTRFIDFQEIQIKQVGHLAPFFEWQIPPFFKIDKITFNRGWFYLLKFPIWFKNKLVGQSIGYRLKKNIMER